MILRGIFEKALSELEQGRTVILVSIADASGSTPRSVGAVMAVGENGILAGTIGGGAVEYTCARIAANPNAPIMTFSLSNQDAADLGMVCGGTTTVLFTPLKHKEVVADLLERIRTFLPGWMILPLDGSEPILETGENAELPSYPHKTSIDGTPCLCLPLCTPGRVFLMGGGHVSLALSRILDVLAYPYIVVDDRTEFSSSERFPHALRQITADFSQLSSALRGPLAPGKQDCVCVMTRGHMSDTEAIRFLLGTSAGYIGLMGSRKKRERLFSQLLTEGFPDAPLRITTPIGLKTGGDTPAEIAVSIAAQLVQWRNTDISGHSI